MRMSAVAAIIETEQERVERWRADELLRAGFDPASAAEVAVRLDVDLHTATELVDRGCPPELALQILL
jgi:succinylglutamate desuccinylase